jgi:hypothetical protein
MLEKDVNRIVVLDTPIATPRSGLPTILAMLSLNRIIIMHKKTDTDKFVQNATVVASSFSVSEAKSLCIKYF